jgi:hypothetical protein
MWASWGARQGLQGSGTVWPLRKAGLLGSKVSLQPYSFYPLGKRQRQNQVPALEVRFQSPGDTGAPECPLPSRAGKAAPTQPGRRSHSSREKRRLHRSERCTMKSVHPESRMPNRSFPKKPKRTQTMTPGAPRTQEHTGLRQSECAGMRSTVDPGGSPGSPRGLQPRAGRAPHRAATGWAPRRGSCARGGRGAARCSPTPYFSSRLVGTQRVMVALAAAHWSRRCCRRCSGRKLCA